jgi:hypothetical protein
LVSACEFERYYLSPLIGPTGGGNEFVDDVISRLRKGFGGCADKEEEKNSFHHECV